MCTYLSKLQAPLLAFLRPGLWCPILNLLHKREEEWQVNDWVPDQCYERVLSGIKQLQHYEKIEIGQDDKENLFLEIFFLTDTCEWLDVVELHFQAGLERGTLVKARSFSSGFCPAWIPFTFIINAILCFFPFYDWKQNKRRLERIRRFSGVNGGNMTGLEHV